MITVTEHTSGYSIARDGETLARLTGDELSELRTRLNEKLTPVGHTTATPAKARLMRWVKPMA